MITKEEKIYNEVVEMLKQGISIPQIASEFSCSMQTIYNIRSYAGLQYVATNRISLEKEERIIEKVKKNESPWLVAQGEGISLSSVYRIMKKHNVTTNHSDPERKEDLERRLKLALQMYTENATGRKIFIATSITPQQLNAYRLRQRVPPRTMRDEITFEPDEKETIDDRV